MGLLALIHKKKECFSEDTIKNDPKYRNFIDNIIPTLKFGDIIYAERFNNDMQKEWMGEGHTTGPFIVVSFDGDKVVGAYCTSNPNIKGGFEIGEYYYLFSRNKRSYATLLNLKTIDAEAFISKHEKRLSLTDINRLKKKICLTKTKYKYDDFCLEKDLDVDFNIEFEIGDVVSDGKNNYIIVGKTEDNKYVIIPINNYDYCYSFIDFSIAKIEYSSIKEIEKNNLIYLNSIPKSQMIIIMSKYNDYLKMKTSIINSETKKLERGCLINSTEGLYYVFGIEGNTANSFAVKKTKIIEGSISIAGKMYIPCYEKTKDFDIKLKAYDILNVASEMEMDKIKEDKKSYKKNKKEASTSKKIKHGDDSKISGELLVCLKENTSIRYIIYNEQEQAYSLIPVSPLLNGEISTLNLPKTAVIKTNNITTEELKIIKRNLERIQSGKLAKKLLKKLY